MGNAAIRPVIAKVVFLDRRERPQGGRVAYAFLILDRTTGTILERLFVARTLREVVAYAIEYRRAHYGLPRISFDPPGGVDRDSGKYPRRYDALELTEIFYASSALGQS